MKKKVFLLIAACAVLVLSMTACSDNNSATEDQADFNGDGVNDVTGTDINGDGIADGFGYDANGDGIADGVVGDVNDANAVTPAAGTEKTDNVTGAADNKTKGADTIGDAVGDGVDDVITGVEDTVDDIGNDLTGNESKNPATNAKNADQNK